MDKTGNAANGSCANKTIMRKDVGVKGPPMKEIKRIAAVKVHSGTMKKA